MQIISSPGFANDHSYYKTPKPNPEFTPEETPEETPNCSTPMNRKKNVGNNLNFYQKTLEAMNTDSVYVHENMDDEDDMLNLSTVSNSFRDDSKDLTYVNESDCDDNSKDDSDEMVESDIVMHKKYICFEKSLMDLFVRLRSGECDSPVNPEDIIKDNSDGTLLRCSIYCSGGHLI